MWSLPACLALTVPWTSAQQTKAHAQQSTYAVVAHQFATQAADVNYGGAQCPPCVSGQISESS